MAVVFYKNTTDGTLCLGPREALVYPFTAVPTWTDLRLGVYLSVTSEAGVDDPVLLTENRAYATAADRLFIGFKFNNDIVPVAGNTVFIGITNAKVGANDNKVVPSSGGVTTVGTEYWRVYRDTGSVATRYIDHAGVITDGSAELTTPVGTGLFLRQTGTGYAALNIVRLLKLGGGLGTSVNKEGGVLINVDYTDAPSVDRTRNFLVASSFVQDGAPPALPYQPTALYFYWPFLQSRLRIHCIVLEKFA